MKKTVLLTNDDGVTSIGLKQAYDALCSEFKVIVVAPHFEQSGVGHSFTYQKPIYCREIKDGFSENIFSVTGSPADCVKFAIGQILPEFPDYIVSGLNIGENSGVSSFYSGTVAGAREGAFWRIRSFAFSLCTGAEKHAEKYATYIPEIMKIINDSKIISDDKVFLNVNFPPFAPCEIKGMKITRQSMAYFQDNYTQDDGDEKIEENKGFTIFGEKIDLESSEEYDSRALLNKWIAITPHTFDSTSYEHYSSLKKIEKNFSFKKV